MILSKIKLYMRTHKRSTMGELCHALNSKPDAITPMLDLLMRKGYIVRANPKKWCEKCPLAIKSCTSECFESKT